MAQRIDLSTIPTQTTWEQLDYHITRMQYLLNGMKLRDQRSGVYLANLKALRDRVGKCEVILNKQIRQPRLFEGA